MCKSRDFLLSSLIATLSLALPAMASDKPTEIHAGNGITLPPPPPTKAKPVTDTVAGQSITDPYRWLEDAKSPDTRAWINSQMRYTERNCSLPHSIAKHSVCHGLLAIHATSSVLCRQPSSPL